MTVILTIQKNDFTLLLFLKRPYNQDMAEKEVQISLKHQFSAIVEIENILKNL